MNVDVVKVWVDDKFVHILTADGVEQTEAIAGYERLRNATLRQLQNFETDNIGIHWPELDEDLSYEGFFKKDAMEDKSELYKLFKAFPEINVAGIARRLGIKQSLMAAYICGTKKPSLARREEIIKELHSLGRALLEVG
ncbi:DUF2442 domain-containing protein [Parabacteroides sp.]